MRSAPAARSRGDAGGGARPQRGQVEVDEVADALDGEIGGRIGGEDLAPRALPGGEDAEPVVHQDVVIGGVSRLDVVELPLLVHVDQAHAGFSWWPPNSKRRAESTLPAKSASPRELKRS